MDQREFYCVRVKGEPWNSLAVLTTDEKGVKHFNLPGRLFGLYEVQEEVLERIPAPGEPPTSEAEAAVLECAIERMGWPQIRAFEEELGRGQDVAEDAGGFMLRAVRRLFGLPSQKASVITSGRPPGPWSGGRHDADRRRASGPRPHRGRPVAGTRAHRH